MGCGDIDVDEPFTADEWEAISDIVAPMAAFVAGLWADDPGQAMLYANRPKIAVSTEARAMWSTKQHAMAPYRDDALLASADSPHYGGARQRMIDGVMDRRIAKRADDAKRRARESSSKTSEARGWKRRR